MLELRYDSLDDFLSTLFFGIDVNSRSNTVCALDLKGNNLLNSNVPKNCPDAESILVNILVCLKNHRLEFVGLNWRQK